LKCKRYIIRNGCLTCECNPCVFDQPISDISYNQGQQKCLVAGDIWKIYSCYDKSYCCSKENDRYCPPISAHSIPFEDTDILFLCLLKCNSDANCKQGEKYYGTHPLRCLSATTSKMDYRRDKFNISIDFFFLFSYSSYRKEMNIFPRAFHVVFFSYNVGR
jgi:hypothetical protein